MAPNNKPNILLFGAGSVGAIYLYHLSKVASVTAVCRSNYEAVKKDGFVINSSIFGQNIHFSPNVVKTCAEAAAGGGSSSSNKFDYVIVCSKVRQGIIPELIRPAVTPGHTVIVLIQNGIGIEEEYVEAFPSNPVVSCVVYLPATQRPVGVITHGEVERLEIGNYPASNNSSYAKEFAQLVRSAGATAELYDDVQAKRWYKLLVNASWNPLCALTLCTDAQFLESSAPANEVVLAIMLEVADIARAYGHPIFRELVDYQLERARARILTKNGVEPSMLQDVRGGRRMEVEAIVGNAVRMAKEKGVNCMRLEMLYVMATALNSRLVANSTS